MRLFGPDPIRRYILEMVPKPAPGLAPPFLVDGTTVYITDDGAGVQDNLLMRRAMEYASGLGVTLAQHCEDDALCGGGHMHEGEWSARLGIPGQPAEAEELMVMRDIALARLTGCRIHFQHLSTARSVAMVREALAAGLPVTAEATPNAPAAPSARSSRPRRARAAATS